MEQDRMLRNFPRINKKSLDLGLEIPKSKFLGFRKRYSFRVKNLEKNGMEQSIPFHSAPGFSSHQLLEQFQRPLVRRNFCKSVV